MPVTVCSFLVFKNFNSKLVKPFSRCLKANVVWISWSQRNVGQKIFIDPTTERTSSQVGPSFYYSILSHTSLPSCLALHSATSLLVVGTLLEDFQESTPYSLGTCSATLVLYAHLSQDLQLTLYQPMTPYGIIAYNDQ